MSSLRRSPLGRFSMLCKSRLLSSALFTAAAPPPPHYPHPRLLSAVPTLLFSECSSNGSPMQLSMNKPLNFLSHHHHHLSSLFAARHAVDAAELTPSSDRPQAPEGQVRRPCGRPLPLPVLPRPHIHRPLHLLIPKVPPFLPYPSRICNLQEMLSLCSGRRAFTALTGFRESGDDGDGETDRDESEDASTGGGGFISGADRLVVENVCKVIDELFELDRNMEAVLDEMVIELTHGIVLAVLERFRHARKPALRFFNWAGRKPGFAHDSRTYNKMMEILGSTKQFETMVAMLEEMGEKRLLRMETFTIAIRAFAASKERKKAVGIFDLMKKHRYKVGAETINCLLDALGRAKLGKEANALFEKLKERFTPDLRTYSVLLNGWCRVKNLLEAGRVWNLMIDKGFKPDIIAHNTMLEGLLKGKKRSDAIKLFEVMKAKGPHPNVRSYTILIRDLCKQGKMEEAEECFHEMVQSGCRPDIAVYTTLITGFGNQKRMDIVYQLLKEMKDVDCPPDGKTYNALIKLVANRRMPDEAVRVYKTMISNGVEPSIHTYNMMMKSYFQNRNCEMSLAVWDEMNRKGLCPDDNSYTVFIGGLISHGSSEAACKYLEEMIGKGMKAPQIDYNKFAADFSRAGRPDILEELSKKMKFMGKFEAANELARWSEMMKKRVKRRDPVKSRSSPADRYG